MNRHGHYYEIIKAFKRSHTRAYDIVTILYGFNMDTINSWLIKKQWRRWQRFKTCCLWLERRNYLPYYKPETIKKNIEAMIEFWDEEKERFTRDQDTTKPPRMPKDWV